MISFIQISPRNAASAAPTPTDLGSNPGGYIRAITQTSPRLVLSRNNKHIEMESGRVLRQWRCPGVVPRLIRWIVAAAVLRSISLRVMISNSISIVQSSLDASNAGDYQGYLIILEGNQYSHPACAINGGSYLNINGTIFAPYCDITVNGDNSTQSRIQCSNHRMGCETEWWQCN